MFCLFIQHIVLFWGLSFCIGSPSYPTHVMINVLMNQCIITPIFMITAGFLNVNYEIPHVTIFIRDLMVAYFFQSITFYFIHRGFHSCKFTYAFHRKHHEYKKPLPYTSIYCHFTEHILANLLPVFIGPYIMYSHYLTICVWAHLTTISAIISHSSNTRKIPNTHDIHHLNPLCNYGTGETLDRIFGTLQLP